MESEQNRRNIAAIELEPHPPTVSAQASPARSPHVSSTFDAKARDVGRFLFEPLGHREGVQFVFDALDHDLVPSDRIGAISNEPKAAVAAHAA